METYDLAIIGGGPAGLATASHAQANGMKYILLERTDHLADTIYNYQARKFVMAEPVMIPSRGDLPFEESAHIASKRGFYQVRAAASAETQLWQSQDSTAWTVVYEQDAQFQLSCLNRFVFVKPVRDLADALHSAASVKGKVSTVGLAAPRARAEDLALQLARWGATRICPIGRMQNPPLTWRHDGRPPLADLLTWTDWES